MWHYNFRHRNNSIILKGYLVYNEHLAVFSFSSFSYSKRMLFVLTMQIDSGLETTKRAHSPHETIYPSLLLRMLSDISLFFFFLLTLSLRKSHDSFSFFDFLFSNLCSILQNVKQIKCMNFWCIPERGRQYMPTFVLKPGILFSSN